MIRHRTALLFIIITVLLTAAACENVTETDYTPVQIAAVIADSQDDLPELMAVGLGDSMFLLYLQDYYELEPDLVADGVVCFTGGAQAEELAVLTGANEQAAGDIAQSLQEYIERRTAAFTGYAPEEAAILQGAEVAVNGKTVALLICADPEAGREAFLRCFGGNAGEFSAQTQFAQAPADEAIRASAAADNIQDEDAYDEAAVLAAWESGDPSGLSEKNRAVYDRCRQVMDEVVSDEMSAYEKELAIHDWIIEWADYDQAVLDDRAGGVPNPDNDNPYGLLIGQTAICEGYTSTFQLMMRMVGIKCITVQGTAYDKTEEHAWNLVQLDGEWYAVDVTWDDPITIGGTSDAMAHAYFNVTSDFLRSTLHEWDEDSVPEATGTTYRWQK